MNVFKAFTDFYKLCKEVHDLMTSHPEIIAEIKAFLADVKGIVAPQTPTQPPA